MAKIQQSLTLDAPIEEVAAYISDPARMPEWNKMIVRVWDVQPAPEVVGTTWKVLVRVIGTEHQVGARINRYEPPEHFGVELLGGAPGVPGLTASLDVEARSVAAPGTLPEARASSTYVICTLNIRFPTLMGGAALGAIVSPIITDQLRNGLINLKRVLETRRRGEAR